MERMFFGTLLTVFMVVGAILGLTVVKDLTAIQGYLVIGVVGIGVGVSLTGFLLSFRKVNPRR